MPNVDPLDDFEKAILKNVKPDNDRKYDYRQLPNDVGGLVKAVAKSAADMLNYAEKVVTAPFRFPSSKAMKKMVDETKKKREEEIRKTDPYWRP